ncbi:ThiJ/PfpI family protein [Colletotrichum higginsianum IMI 349063]|uniref:ThiJ/PfpI family protein n=2 Tax=Colletotrichum higginsianum TaxID=80884 RepID=A0A1B7YBQ0_COLHI|nr:ThiJ/PfpI family protein [Colletotrichum higginsianum IMI 349063]OBR09394.1 ThiJ/PfpI family protein [Colletotrichum higginsianum IMI 349063]TIC95833.1 hypothetical protein CH35J_008010 [Colletotrichum higginsianum]
MISLAHDERKENSLLTCHRRKCDLRPDACGQCRRAGLLCHGYRNPDALQFRNENRSAEQRALARRGDVRYPPGSRPAVLELSWDTRARYAFFSTYVNTFTRSMNEIAHHYRTAREMDHLSASVEAISQAFMAVQLGNPELLRSAKSSYVTAIQRLGHILNSLEADESERALQTVLLLDMYEKLVHRDPGTSQSWLSHAHGGLSLLGARVTSIISTPTGCQVAARLVTAVTVSSATVGDRVPPQLAAVRHNIGYRVKGVKWTFLGVLGLVVNLKSDVTRGGVSPLDLLLRAKDLDNQIKTLDRARPAEWLPRTVQVPTDERVLGQSYDVYPDHYITQVSNAICTIRLILYDLVQRHIPMETRPRDDIFHGTIRDSVSQICASVPQFILPGVHETNSLPFSPVQQLHCSTLLAPLYLINQVSEDEAVKAWILRCLRFMWGSGGFKAAKEIMHVLQTTPDLDYWTVFAKTGSYAILA